MAAAHPKVTRTRTTSITELLRSNFTVKYLWYSWYVSEQDYTLVLTKKCLYWDNCNDPNDTVVSRIADILSAKCKKEDDTTSTLEIAHVVTKNYVKTVKHVSFRAPAAQSEEWCKAINEGITRLCPNRPKRLLVFVSPRSGDGKGVKLYHTTVEPIFKLCDINIDLIVTAKPHEPSEVLESYDISSVDGLVASGGDGMFIDVVNGLLRRTAKHADVNLDDADAELPDVPLPLGFIPCSSGFGNTHASCMHRTADVTTAAIAIVQGEVIPKDVASVRSNGEFLSFSSIVTTGSFVEDLTHILMSDKMHWMGHAKYYFVRMFVSKYLYRIVDLEIEFLNAPVPTVLTPSHGPPAASGSSEGATKPDSTEPKTDTPESGQAGASSDDTSTVYNYRNPKSGWEKISGRFVQAISFILDFKSTQRRSVFNDGNMLIYTIKEGNFLLNMKAFAAMWKMDPEAYNFNNVFVRKATAIRVKATGDWAENPESHKLLIDGEQYTLKVPEYELKIHPQLVKMYGQNLFQC